MATTVKTRKASELYKLGLSIVHREVDCARGIVKVTIHKVLDGELEKPATYIVEKGVKVRDDVVAVRLRGERA